jgi:hypothetical protein
MEKSQTRSLAKRVPLINDETYSIPPVIIGRSADAPGRRDQRPDKPSRKDISRCINIWASLYLAPDASSDDSSAGHELCLPSRPWTGRNPGSLKRFE